VSVRADLDRCIGAGQCAFNAPDLFDSDEDGFVRVLVSEPDDDQVQRARQAVRLCPVRALSLTEP
jgi:ferredoxin